MFIKLFKTNAIDIVKVCQEYFDFELPNVVIEKRKKTFLSRLNKPTFDLHAIYTVSQKREALYSCPNFAKY